MTEVILLPEGEPPVHYNVEKDGCFSLKTDKYRIKMVVKVPYYLPDTIEGIVRKMKARETIMLAPDNYSMMIHYFSTMKVDDWEKRRNQLDQMIDDGAMICQVINDKNETGVALLNKDEFINKMTVPSGSLKNLEILGTQVKNGKIMLLKYRIKGGLK
jgi:hypothetical protein